MSIETRIKEIRRARRARNIPIMALAKMAGLPPSTIQEMDAADWNPKLQTLLAVDRALFPQERRRRK